MIRPITIISALLFLLSGFAVFFVKHQAVVLDARIERAAGQIHNTRARIRLLRADWADENAPDRLSRLAQSWLTLQPTAPGQFASFATLASRLPPVRAHPDQPMDQTPPPAALDVASANGASAKQPNAGVANGPTSAAMANGPAGAPIALATPAPSRPAATPSAPPVRLARLPVARSAPRPIARPIAAAVPPAPRRVRPARPRLTQVRYRAPVPAVPAWHPPAWHPPVARTGSMLGMARGSAAAPPPPAPLPYSSGGGD